MTSGSSCAPCTSPPACRASVDSFSGRLAFLRSDMLLPRGYVMTQHAGTAKGSHRIDHGSVGVPGWSTVNREKHPTITSLLAFVGVSAIVIMTPGPDTAVTVRNTLLGGRMAGLSTALGISTGLAIWALATSCGVVALLVA